MLSHSQTLFFDDPKRDFSEIANFWKFRMRFSLLGANPFPLLFLFLFLSLVDSPIPLLAQHQPTNAFRLGGSSQTFQSRFVSQENSLQTSIWGEIDWKGLAVVGEQRQQRGVGGIQFRNDFFHIAGGHRYKTVPGFFLGRDPDFFATLGNHQPLRRSGFLSLLPGYYSPGFFWIEGTNEKRPGYSLVLPNSQLALTYSPDTKIQSLYANFQRVKIRSALLPDFYATWFGEGMGTKTRYFGNYLWRLESPSSTWEWETRAYKDDNGILLQSPDGFNDSPENPLVLWSAIRYANAIKLELFDSQDPGLRQQFASLLGFVPIWDWGGPGVRYREIHETRYSGDSRELLRVKAGALGWGLHSKNWSYWIIREFRENRDSLTEGAVQWKRGAWRLEGSLLFQKEGNLLATPVVRFTGMESEQISLTDRKTVFRFRVKSNFLDWNVTASDRMDRRGSLFFMSLQGFLEF